MNNIYNFLRDVLREILIENKKNKLFLPFLLLLITLPISMALNNILLAFFIFLFLLNIKKSKCKPSFSIIVPIILYVWMCLSSFWTIDFESTIKAISKESALLLIPLMFIWIPKFSDNQRKMIITYYSYTMILYVCYFLLRALIRFIITNDTSYFFYHGPDNYTDTGLVPRLLNAIHISVYVTISFFHFFIKENKSKFDYIFSLLLFIFVILLSSKNIIIVFILLILVQVFFYSKVANRLRLRNLTLLLFIFGFLISFSKIKERFLIEFKTNTQNSVELNKNGGVNNISIIQAWQNESFTHNDYFPGTAFRVYQFRMFVEFLKEEPIFWKGFGLNASQKKLLEKEKIYNLYPGYGSFNFHNQYVQIFAELGIIGFVLLLILMLINTRNAFKSKDFIHIAFSILMISLFLTESFIWRQRGVLFFTLFYCFYNKKKND